METWKKCSSCKKEIPYGGRYYICSVSTCQGQRTGYAFCSVPCFEVHLPGARHKDAAAIEERAPSSSAASTAADSGGQQRRIVRPTTTTSNSNIVPSVSTANIEKEVLIVASKLKKFIKSASDMNTSDGVMDPLSDFVRDQALKAIERARKEGRKTVLARDFGV